EQLTALQAAAAGSDPRAAATRTIFLRNVLMRVPEFRESLATLKAAPGEEAEPFTRFVKMESPVFAPAAADTSLTFSLEPIAEVANRAVRWSWVGAIALGSEGAPIVANANGHEVQLARGAAMPFPGGSSAVSPQPEGVLQIDFNYDFKTD